MPFFVILHLIMHTVNVSNLNKVYVNGLKNIKVIENISFKIDDGEFVCIVGPSFCGKTTLLKCLCSLLKTTSGTISINGKSNIVFQEYSKSLFGWKTVKGNIMFGLKKGGQKITGVGALTKLVNLEGFENNYPHQLSGGMQQRVVIARALAYNPKILFMDEPFGSLDAQTKMKMEDMLLNIWSKLGKTILFVTHDIGEAVYLADRVIVLSKRPAKVIGDIKINLKRPRNQLKTKQTKEYILLWKKIYKLLEK